MVTVQLVCMNVYVPIYSEGRQWEADRDVHTHTTEINEIIFPIPYAERKELKSVEWSRGNGRRGHPK